MAYVDLRKTQPASYQAAGELHRVSIRAASDAGLSAGVVQLINIRASQLNGCAYCLRVHTADAMKLGETTDRLAVLPAWRETTDYFTDVEVAALEVTEYVTRISSAELSSETHHRIRTTLSAEQVAAVYWLTIAINTFNRIAISSHLLVRPLSSSDGPGL